VIELDVQYDYDALYPQILFFPSYVILSASPTFSMPGLDSFIGGPSGGLMQTMALYTSLLNLDLGNLVIAGTGTMEIDGRVGRIGGVTQKLFTAERLGVDVFFMPEAHRDDVIDYPFSFEIIYVDYIDEAILKIGELL
jgi:Lon-like protease